ncbi:MAG: ATP-dependent DNA helicase RecG, partial [Chloroflexota bacterium]|nr:ATP-dependent DNA helicase RecG [Chloroflexota bacterium]
QQLPGRGIAYEQLHYPDSWGDLELAQRRLAFDNLFLLQLGLVRRKQTRHARGGVPVENDPSVLAAFLSVLPFKLTHAQHRALGEILNDLQLAHPMGRLLQGDVGSGKTVVAAAAMLLVTTNGFQSAVMAPTELLAEQHYHNLRGLFLELPAHGRPELALLTGSITGGARQKVRRAVATGQVDILVGTQAIIQEGVVFQDLAFIVIDEQHRFGVRQRADLIEKAHTAQPHTLAMTATPIPRTLNMVLNGDLDVSIIDELPPARTPVVTQRYVGADRDIAYQTVRAEVQAGHQVFVICPLVEESESIEAKAAVAEAERLQHDVFPDLRVALLHGRMSAKEKDAIMTTFRDGGSDVLVSTSVIEVGIDVPNATVMLVEGADRFGLSQLHQFRGRVGRGAARSYCLFLAEEASPDGEERLQTLVSTTDGFVLAEKDLELRGPGDFIGVRQSGLPEMGWLDGSFDARLLDSARQAAEALLRNDPELTKSEHSQLRTRLERFWASTAAEVSQ